MKYFIIILTLFLFSGCDKIGSGASYPYIYSKDSPECGCGGSMYIIKTRMRKLKKSLLFLQDRAEHLLKNEKIFI